MKLQELLDHIGGPSMLDDRVEQLSGEADELFSDATIVRHLNEGQRRLCRDAWILEDTQTAEVCEVPLTEDQTDYDIHKSVLGIKYIRLSDSDVDLLRVGYDDNRLHAAIASFDPDFWDVNVQTSETSGRPSRWSADIGTRVIRVRQKPDATAAALKLRLAVVRMPLVDLDPAKLSASPEVPEEYHMDLAEYAAGKCLASANVDAELKVQGRSWVKGFDERVRKAMRDRQRFQQAAPQWRCGGWGRGNS